MKTLTQGDVVQLPHQWDNELGIVYELYKDFDDGSKSGVSIITESGRDLGGFSFKEQQQYLELVSRTGFEYPFKNVIQLGRDFMDGMFLEAFKVAHQAKAAKS